MNFTESIDRISNITDFIFFVAFVSLSLVMIVKVKGKLEVAMWVAVVAYNMVFLVGLTLSVLNVFTTVVKHDLLIQFKKVSRFAIWLVHFYFVLAMKDVHLKLTCENPT